LIARANRANIERVIVDGRVPIDAGRYVHGDEVAIISAGGRGVWQICDLPEAAFNDSRTIDALACLDGRDVPQRFSCQTWRRRCLSIWCCAAVG
jgi:hypothetical protein